MGRKVSKPQSQQYPYVDSRDWAFDDKADLSQSWLGALTDLLGLSLGGSCILRFCSIDSSSKSLL